MLMDLLYKVLILDLNVILYNHLHLRHLKFLYQHLHLHLLLDNLLMLKDQFLLLQ
uniref:Uncharacterized protein n=1 Tax=uncultured marine virus TaxID=186617 RepID=A0A0F7L9L7_9VIRU|nr:hypothetical protein [uncultured marine virus]